MEGECQLSKKSLELLLRTGNLKIKFCKVNCFQKTGALRMGVYSNYFKTIWCRLGTESFAVVLVAMLCESMFFWESFEVVIDGKSIGDLTLNW